MTDLIKEFFTDGICRIVPGGVIIALYFQNQLLEKINENATHEGTILVLFSAVAAAWLIGIVLETVGYVFPLILLELLCWCSGSEGLKKFSEDLVQPDKRTLSRPYEKLRAERILFRQMWVISAITLLNNWVGVIKGLHLPDWWNVSYGRWGLIVFFPAWLWAFLRAFCQARRRRRLKP